jgi:AcrR family transcriptional regulator
MTVPKRPRRTVERILETALRLFNEWGEPNVTTTQLASELSISPGNLYYHFKNKEAIVELLFDRFALELADALIVAERRSITLEDMWLQLHLVFETIWRYRFVYRDLNDLLTRYRKIREHFRRVINEQTAAGTSIFRGLAAAGEMIASEEEMEALARNMVLIATYWLSFENARGAKFSDCDIGRGVYQVMSAIAPFLTGEARSLLQRLSKDYL